MTQPNAKSDTSRAFDISHTGVLKIALPMTLAYLSTPILGIVDTAVIGRLGDAALLGGIAVASILFDLVFTTFNFLRSGTTALTAQAFGADGKREIKASLLRALLIAALAGTAVVVLHVALLDFGLTLIGGSADVQSAARRYFEVRIYSAPLMLANYAILGWLLGLGRAGTGLFLQTVLNGLNVALSIYFVIGLEWSVEGAAWATVASECLACLLGLALVKAVGRGGAWPTWSEVIDKTALRRMMAVNRDIMIRSFTLLFAFTFFTQRSAAQGDGILAANAILEKFFLVGGYFLDGLATAAEQLAGRAVGARYRPAFDKAVRITAIWSFLLAGLLAAFYLGFGSSLVRMMTVSEDVRQIAYTYLPWAAITPLCGVLAFQMDGVFIGATWSRDMRNMMLVSLLVFIIAYFSLFPLLQNHGLWLALEIFLGARGLSLLMICSRRRNETFAPA
ncbi:MATE family efflux transporter [Roseibium sp. CAU 1637]|uniref:MATE family efflux transporter n=1 Tax=Roseibium limicola TaxID=2816037 RepID=A0A939EP21_9HYPH|nr:MATE family efflux transporter [Roseibium limicola]MBO0345437.1 MATE family efflux transporter [Roseibium limicola]